MASLLDSDEMVQAAYLGFVEILSSDCAKISTFENEKIEYEPNKSRLKQGVRGYFEYFCNELNPVIVFADALNFKSDLSNCDAFIALKFNGVNSVEKIIEQAEKFIKDNKLNLTDDDKIVNPNNKKEFKKAVQKYVKHIEAKLMDGHFFERI